MGTTLTEAEYFILIEDNRRMLQHEAARILDLPLDAEAVEYVVSGTIQDIWKLLFYDHRQLTTGDDFPGYLRIAVRRDALDYIRAAPEETALEDLLPEAFEGDDPLETLNITYNPPLSLINDVQAALTKLTPEQRHMVWSVVVEGFTLLEAGRGAGFRHKETARRVFHSGLWRLRYVLSAYDVRRPPHPGV